MIWLWVVGYLAVACGVAYLVGRFGDYGCRDKVVLVAFTWPCVLVFAVPFGLLWIVEALMELGERHRK